MIHKNLFILSLLFLAACGTAYRPDLNKAEALMVDHPDSSLNILEKIRIERVRGRKNKAKYALLYSQALDKNYIDVESDSIIRVARDYYAHRGSNEERVQAFYYYGIVANNAGDIDEAMKAFIPARIYAEKTDNEFVKGLIYLAIGNLYYDQNSLAEAIEQFDKAEESFIKTGRLMNQFLITHKKAATYRLLEQYDSTLHCLQRAKNIATILNDTLQIINVASLYYSVQLNMIDNIDSTKIHKQNLFNMYKELNHNHIPVDHYHILGKLYFKESNRDSMHYYIGRYLKHVKSITADNVGIYSMLSLSEESNRDYQNALKYKKLYCQYNDSIVEIQTENHIEKLEQKYKAQYLQRSYEILEAKHKLQKVSNSLIMILTTIIGGVVLFLYRYIMMRNNQKIEEYRLYIEDVDSNYDNLTLKYKHLKELAASQYETADKLLQLLGRRIDSLKKLCDISITSVLPHKFKERFKEYINLENKDNKAMAEDMITLANIMYNNTIARLDAKYGLTDHEKTFCACVILDFSKEEIRVLFNHTNIASIYNTRCKIRDKFGMKGSTLDVLKYIIAMRDNSEIADDNQLLISELNAKGQMLDNLSFVNIIFE